MDESNADLGTRTIDQMYDWHATSDPLFREYGDALDFDVALKEIPLWFCRSQTLTRYSAVRARDPTGLRTKFESVKVCTDSTDSNTDFDEFDPLRVSVCYTLRTP
jgi:hypothetical protein